MPQSRTDSIYEGYLQLLALLGSEPPNPAKKQDSPETDEETQRRLALAHQLRQDHL